MAEAASNLPTAVPPGSAPPSSYDTEVGRIVSDMGLATHEEIATCREEQKQSSDPSQRSLSDLLVEHGYITGPQARRVRQRAEQARATQIPGYQLISKLGKGAMATVYKARQLRLNRIVAVKVLPKRMSDNREFVDRFYKEGQAAARLSHSNIVQAIDVNSTPDGYHYFVMEYVEGKTLYDLMAPPPIGDGKKFSEAEALDVAMQIADALAHAHQRGLIHRDVKPKNIILTPDSVAKLTDLGLARATDDKAAAESEAGKAYGTPYYISPEQIRGEIDIDARADIYSLGATLYHLVTGRPPFEAESPTAVMHKHLKQPLLPPDHVNTALSAGVGEIIETAMAKNRDERYSDMQQMLEDLNAVRRGDTPVHARRSIDYDQLAKIEETGKTVDLAPPLKSVRWTHPAIVALLASAGASVLINLILLVILLTKK
ncbi:MAG TPA: serine/threonine-protein kinase [Tepidisphaeraceae bacterium]|jgi:serine/threonine-protein kinase|nr:serine/threonine-protein kinase [Tepidisphaeraceae bacterium]